MAPHTPLSSQVWKHMRKLSAETVQCVHCFKHYRNSGNTTNFWKHIETKHGFRRPTANTDSVTADEDNEVRESEDSDIDSNLGCADSGEGQRAAESRPSSAGSGTSRRSLASVFSPPPSPTLSSPPPHQSPAVNPKRSTSDAGVCRSCGCSCASSRKKQKTIEDSFNQQKSFDDGGSRSAVLKDAMLYMICKDRMPLQTPERAGFKYFVKKAVPLWNPPSRQTTTRLMEDKYTSVSSLVKTTLSAVESICLTADCWTETHTTASYLGLTTHHLKGIQFESCILGITHLTESHSTAYLAETMENILHQWGIDKRNVSMVVTDSAENIKQAVIQVFGADRQNPCFAHLLNRIPHTAFESREVSETITLPNGKKEVVKKKVEHVPGLANHLSKVKRIVTFSKRSYNFTNTLISLQMERGKTHGTCLRLIEDVSTRWNSKYNMLKRFLDLSDLVSMAATRFPDIVMLNGAELASLRAVMDILKPFSSATNELSAEKSTTLSKVIPVTEILRKKLEKVAVPVGDTVVTKLKQYMLSEIERRFGCVEANRNMAVATLLDPRFKKEFFKSPVRMAEALTYISNEAKKIMRTSSTSNAATEAPGQSGEQIESDDLWSDHKTAVRQSRLAAGDDFPGGYPVELRQYLNKPLHEITENPLELWESMKDEYPNLYPIARRFLSMLATSCPSERLFSGAGLIASDLRTRTTPEHFHQETFLVATSLETWLAASGAHQ